MYPVLFLQAQGYTRQEITFTGSVHIRQIGHAVLRLDAWNEDYLQTLPSVMIKSLLSGSPYPELNGTVHIYSSSGYTSKIEFSGTSMMGLRGNKKNCVHATLFKNRDEENPLYEVEGQWSDQIVFRNARKKEDLETYDTHKSQTTPLIVAPVEQQDPWESRRAWSGVVKALQSNDMQGTSDAKSMIEETQREMRKKEEAEGREWKAKFFSRVDTDSEFEKLALPHGEHLQPDMTGGIWRFDVEKFRSAKVPFHGDLTPWAMNQTD
jgi:oxysterol-binding protein-related protein 9/10/11